MASVHPRQNREGEWYQVKWRLGGGRGAPWQTEGFDTEEEAEEFKRKVDAAGQQWPPGWVKGQGEISHTPFAFREFALKAVTEKTGVEDSTRDSDLGRLKDWILPTFGNCDVRSREHFSRATVSAWVRRLEQTKVIHGSKPAKGPGRATARPMAPATVRRNFFLLSGVLQAAVDMELRDRNPCKGVPLPRADSTADDSMEFMTPQEVALLTDCFELRQEQLFVTVKYGMGLRWGEITALRPRDFLSAAKPKLRVQRAWKRRKGGAYIGAPKSRMSRRTIGVSPTVAVALAELASGKRRDDLLFTGTNGASRLSYSTFWRHWAAAVERAAEKGFAKEPTPHDLRHSHAAALISAGHSLTYVQRRLGHDSIQITSDLYGHLLPEAEDAALESIEAALSGQAPRLRSV